MGGQMRAHKRGASLGARMHVCVRTLHGMPDLRQVGVAVCTNVQSRLYAHCDGIRTRQHYFFCRFEALEPKVRELVNSLRVKTFLVPVALLGLTGPCRPKCTESSITQCAVCRHCARHCTVTTQSMPQSQHRAQRSHDAVFLWVAVAATATVAAIAARSMQMSVHLGTHVVYTSPLHRPSSLNGLSRPATTRHTHCPAPPRPALPRPAPPRPALHCPALPCTALHCPPVRTTAQDQRRGRRHCSRRSWRR